MPYALFLYNNNGKIEKYPIDFHLTKKGPGHGLFRDFDVINMTDNFCTYEDYMGNEYSFILPKFEEREFFKSCRDIQITHDNNKQQFCGVSKPPRTWYFRVKFQNKEMRKKFQILALYDGSLTPLDLPNGIERHEIYFN